MKISRGLQQAYDAQNFAHGALMALKESLTQDGKLVLTREDALSIKALVSAWESAQMRIAFHRRVPSPGVLKREPEPKRKPKSNGVSLWIDPIEPTSPDLPVPGVGNGHGTT